MRKCRVDKGVVRWGAVLVVGAARGWSPYWWLDGAPWLVREVVVVGGLRSQVLVSHVLLGERSMVSTGGERCWWLAPLGDGRRTGGWTGRTGS